MGASIGRGRNSRSRTHGGNTQTYLGRKRELYAPLSAPPATGWAPGLAASPLLDPHCGKPAPLEEILRAASREYVHHSRDHAGPAGLMARAEARPIVAVEVLVEQ